MYIIYTINKNYVNNTKNIANKVKLRLVPQSRPRGSAYISKSHTVALYFCRSYLALCFSCSLTNLSIMSDAQTVSVGQAVASATDAAKPKSIASKKKMTTGKAAVGKKHTVDHPKYSEMVHQALGSLKERGGSSRQAVLKYIMKNFNVGKDENVVNTHLKIALRSGVKNASLKQSKGSGATGSFRLGEEAKKPKKTAAAAKATKKAKTPPAAKIRKTNKTTASDKSPSKKMTKKATTKSASVKKPASTKTAKKPKAAVKAKTEKPKKAVAATAKKVKSDKPKKSSPAKKVVKKPVAKKTPVAKKPAAVKKS